MDNFSAAGATQSHGSSLGAECCPAENQRGVSAAEVISCSSCHYLPSLVTSYICSQRGSELHIKDL